MMTASNPGIKRKDLSFPIHYVQVAESLVRARGGNVDRLHQRCGVNPSDLSDPSATIDGEQLYKVIMACIEHCLPGEPPATQILRHFPLTALGPLGMLVITSETIGDALATALPYIELIMPAFTFRRVIESQGIRVRVTLACDFGSASGVLTEIAVGILMGITPYAMSQGLPLHVQFSHACLGGTQAYAVLFGKDVQFNSPHTEFHVTADVLTQPLITANRAARAAMESMLVKQVEARPLQKPLTQRIGRIVAAHLSSGHTPLIESVAQELALSPRSLSRHLQAESETFMAILDRLRIEQAERLLLTTTYAINEIARRTGFRDASSFARTFRRATGTSPNETRSKARSNGATC